jgi:hypothetical protein
MYAGRLANIPVSAFYESPTVTLRSTIAKPFFYASCRDQNLDRGGGRNVSDVTMFLVISDEANNIVEVKHDDGGSPCGNGGANGAKIYGRADGAEYRYKALLVSNRRNTALCSISRADTEILDAAGPGTCGLGTSKVSLATNRQVGGTLVKVGPLPQGDTFEVQTPLNGASQNVDRTRMMLLRLDGGSGRSLSGVPVGASDQDPHLTVPSGFSDTAENYILLGKSGTTSASNEGVETRVDLLHGPLNLRTVGGAFHPSESRGLNLSSGRWNIEVTGRPRQAVGDGDDGVAEQDRPCRLDPFVPPGRGALNRPGFALGLQIQDEGVWRPDRSVAERLIPLGAFGNALNDHSIYLNKEVVRSTQLRPVVGENAPGWTWGIWSAHRNPDNSAIRLATQNMLYRDAHPVATPEGTVGAMVEDEINEYRNAAHLFASRGSISKSNLQVRDPTDRGPHEWDADVVVLTEGNDTPGEPRRLNAFLDEANGTGSRRWVGTQQIGEYWPLPNRRDSNNMLFAASNVNGGLVCEKEDAPANVGRCRRRPLDDVLSGGIRNFVVPGFVNALRRIGFTHSVAPADSTPIGVMAVHLDTNILARRFEVLHLADQMEDVLRKNANRINRAGQTDPRSSGNRFVVIGDVNTKHHECGETYWLLRSLRERFGYAVDLAMAMDDSTGNSRHYAMHNQGPNLVAGIPDPYQSKNNWAKLGPEEQWRSSIDRTMRFPWWAGTSPGQSADAEAGSHERLDQIWLVGRGWEKDDVGSLHYKVLSAIKVASPFSLNGSPFGVETWAFTSSVRAPSNTRYEITSSYRLSGSEINLATCSAAPPYNCDYRPYHSVLGGGAALGAAAIHTDHLAVMGAVPIFGGAGHR